MALAHLNRVHSGKMNNVLQGLTESHLAQVKILEALDLTKLSLKDTAEAAEVVKLRDVISNSAIRLEEAKGDLDLDTATMREAWKDLLRDDWLKYKEPTQTMQGYICKYESEVGIIRPKQEGPMFVEDNEGNCMQAVLAIPKNPLPPTTGNTNELPVIRETDLDRRKFNYKISAPLAFNGSITYSLVKDNLTRSALSGALNWPTTLKRLLRHGTRVGFTRDQVAEAIKILAEYHLPEYYVHIELLEDANLIWELASTFIDVHTVLNAIDKALMKVRRHPGEDVSFCLRNICTLMIEKGKIRFPKTSNAKLTEEAERQTRYLIRDFVSPALWAQLREWRHRMRTTKGKEVINLTDIMNTISDLEAEHTHLKITQTKQIERRSSLQLEINHTEGTVAEWPAEAEYEETPEEACYNTDAEAEESEGETPVKPEPRIPPSRGRNGHQTRSKGAVPDQPWVMKTSHRTVGRSKYKNSERRSPPLYKPPEAKRKRKDGYSAQSSSSGSESKREVAKKRDPSSEGRSYRDSERRDRRRRESGDYTSPRYGSRDRSTSADDGYRFGRRDRRDRSRSRTQSPEQRRRSRSRNRSEAYSRSRTQRAPRTKSPFSGKKRIVYEDKRTGEWRSLSRERMFLRKPDGTRSPRMLSRSPSQPREYRKCSNCNRTHSGPCNVRKNETASGSLAPTPIFHINAEPLN